MATNMYKLTGSVLTRWQFMLSVLLLAVLSNIAEIPKTQIGNVSRWRLWRIFRNSKNFPMILILQGHQWEYTIILLFIYLFLLISRIFYEIFSEDLGQILYKNQQTPALDKPAIGQRGIFWGGIFWDVVISKQRVTDVPPPSAARYVTHTTFEIIKNYSNIMPQSI